MHKPAIRIGTRASRLALTQTGLVRRQLEKLYPSERFRIVKIKTAGDEFKSVEIFKQTGIGVFTKAIEKKLLANEIDLAVHSLKDLPTTSPKNLILAAIPKRASANDVLVSKNKHTLQTLPAGASVGTGSKRRAAQIRLRRPDIRVIPIRGNLDTRAAKTLRSGALDAIVLAEAGLKRLGRYSNYYRRISQDEMMPAVGQGALGIQSRSGDDRARRLAARLHHAKTAILVNAEREFLKHLGGGCQVPVGVTSRFLKGQVFFSGAVFSCSSAKTIRGSFKAKPSSSMGAAKKLARRLLAQGARQLMRQSRS